MRSLAPLLAWLVLTCGHPIPAMAQQSYPADTLTWTGAPPCWSGAGLCQGMPRDSGYTAEVRCINGLPHPHYEADTTLHGIARAETVKHETTHVMQLLGGCDSIMAMWARDTFVRLDAEIQATCKGLTVYQDSTTRARRERESIQALGMLYRKQMLSGDLYRAFTIHCHTAD